MGNHRPHQHLILDAVINKAPKNEDDMKTLLSHIIREIGMRVADLSNGQPNPIAWYCKDEGNEGMTASAILTTSHIVLHVWDNTQPGEIHFDLYSCSDFNPEKVVEILNREFDIVGGFGHFIDRLTGDSKKFKLEPSDKESLVNQEIVNYAKKLSW